MIASVRGVVQALDGDGCVIETGGGVGYRLLASARTLARLETGAAGFLLVEMQVREDQITLFGFATPAERLWFAHLTSVQGVGGRVALAILSALSIEDLERAIAGDDKAMIARANGVGPRLATRIISELKTRAPALAAVGGARPALAGSHGRDAVSALENLGFRTIDATRAVDAAAGELGPDGELAALVRLALRKANEGRPA
jgi:Holliday junction DNA helicase RuvA